MRSFIAQQDRMQVFKVRSRLSMMFSTFDLCLLLYVIGLAGWLKHCSLSLSRQQGCAARAWPCPWQALQGAQDGRGH